MDGISRQPEVAGELLGMLLLSLAFMESLTIDGLALTLRTFLMMRWWINECPLAFIGLVVTLR